MTVTDNLISQSVIGLDFIGIVSDSVTHNKLKTAVISVWSSLYPGRSPKHVESFCFPLYVDYQQLTNISLSLTHAPVFSNQNFIKYTTETSNIKQFKPF